MKSREICIKFPCLVTHVLTLLITGKVFNIFNIMKKGQQLRWFDKLNYLFKLFIHMKQISIAANIYIIVYNNNVSLDTFHSIVCKNQRYKLVLQMLLTYLQQTIETFPSNERDWNSLNANLPFSAKLGAEFPIAMNATSNIKNSI